MRDNSPRETFSLQTLTYKVNQKTLEVTTNSGEMCKKIQNDICNIVFKLEKEYGMNMEITGETRANNSSNKESIEAAVTGDVCNTVDSERAVDEASIAEDREEPYQVQVQQEQSHTTNINESNANEIAKSNSRHNTNGQNKNTSSSNDGSNPAMKHVLGLTKELASLKDELYRTTQGLAKFVGKTATKEDMSVLKSEMETVANTLHVKLDEELERRCTVAWGGEKEDEIKHLKDAMVQMAINEVLFAMCGSSSCTQLTFSTYFFFSI